MTPWHDIDAGLHGLVVVLLTVALVVAACAVRFKAGEVDLQADRHSGSSSSNPQPSRPELRPESD